MTVGPEFLRFVEHVRGAPPSDRDIEYVSPDEAMELAWPLNDILLPHRRAIEDLPYDIEAEPECDAAIMAFALRPTAATLAPLSPPGWRVLQDRHVGFLTLAASNKAAGSISFFPLPRRFPEEHRLGALMLYYYLRFPRSHLPKPPPSSAPVRRTGRARQPRKPRQAKTPDPDTSPSPPEPVETQSPPSALPVRIHVWRPPRTPIDVRTLLMIVGFVALLYGALRVFV